jgi:hypothetical protein
MNPEDYNHALFTAANVSELREHLQELRATYEQRKDNQAFRIFRELDSLSTRRRGLRLDTRYGLASYSHDMPPSLQPQVLFDGDISTTGVGWKAINTFWFEMEEV